jgi:predicted transcriptional regulator of viral defense system
MAISRPKHGTSSAVSRSRDLTRRGHSREEIRRLAAKGDLERAGRGVYLTPPASRSPHRDLLVVAIRAPNAVVCLLSALAYHQLTTEMPHEVWIAVGLKARTPAIDSPPIRVVRLSGAPMSAGIETHLERGVPLRIFSPGKTVADCFKFRSKIGIDVALRALRDGWREKRFTIDELWHFAQVCRVGSVMRPYLEALAG